MFIAVGNEIALKLSQERNVSLSPINGLENFKKASVAINIPCLWHCELLQSVSKPALLLKCGEHRANISQKIWSVLASTALWLFQNPER